MRMTLSGCRQRLRRRRIQYPEAMNRNPLGPVFSATEDVHSRQEECMKAMTYRGAYKIRVEEKPEPRIEHPNDAIVRVERAAICGSDLHLYHGMMPDTMIGHTFGHEFIGTVEKVGSSVQNVKPGDRVMVPFNV